MEYQEFREQYEQMRPASVPKLKTVPSEYPRWLAPAAILMFISSAFVSGLHTTSAVHSTLEYTWTAIGQFKDAAAIASFFGFELLLLLSMFAWLRSRGRKLAYITTAVVFAVVLLTNVSDVARSATHDTIGALTIFGLGLGTPLVVLLSGKLLMDTYHAARNVEQQSKDNYDTACIAWDLEIKKEWDKHQKPSKRASESRPTTVQQSSDIGQPQGASDRVRKFFEDNQSVLLNDKLGVRGIAKHLNVGHQTVSTVRNQMRAAMGNNGHHELNGNSHE